MHERFDLIICGGGLAGLCLARQLSLTNGNLSILVLEAQRRPLPEAAFKVGESTIEAGAFYYRDTLALASYLEHDHLEKLGLRYFFRGPDGNAGLGTRPEYGVARFLPAKSHQIDRGKMENHLRAVVEAAGVILKEGVHVKEIRLDARNGHTVTYREDGHEYQAHSTWVVDAMGRRRYLQHKLGLALDNDGTFNSSWWRVRGKLRVQDLTPDAPLRFHQRVDEDRWNSTNHLMGKGYWVWLIPLGPDNTSVGIVASEEHHSFDQYNTFEKAMDWLARNEPLVAAAMPRYEVLDFKKLKNYSYTSRQAFSIDRWACIGEAATFADPYYSVGSNMIAFANGFVCRMIELERQSQLTAEYVAHANRYLITINDALTDTIHRGYPFLDNGPVLSLKTIWDYYIGWGTTDPQLYHESYLDPKRAAAISGLLSSQVITQARLMRLFEQWGERESGYRFEFIDYIDDLPALTDLHKRSLPPKNPDFRWLLNFIREAAGKIEEVAHVIFFLAVADLYPQEMPRFEKNPWINTEAISLQPDRWEQDGLFQPKTRPRDLTPLRQEFERLFAREASKVQAAGES
jgi:flavin-dependent dehydrogenase